MKNRLTKIFCALILALTCTSMSACQASDKPEEDTVPTQTEKNEDITNEESTEDEFAEEVYDEEEPSETVDDSGVVEEEVYDDSEDAASGIQDEQATEEVVE